MLRLAVFASGKGSNLRAIDRAIRSGALGGISLELVLSNNSDAEALAYARNSGIAAVHLSGAMANSEEHLGEEMLRVLGEHKIDIIALAGYMKKIPAAVVREFRGRLVNIHPSLLPAFGGEGMYGMNVHRAVIASGAKKTGATVHFVDADYDSGEIIAQAECDVLAGDTAEILAKRVLLLEHELYPRALQIVVSDRWPVASKNASDDSKR
ncbi:MAG TPA: phosphoribosylglycinamide formyltransferase [Candidatus Kapabacteria bacterium]|nr:phosphoribosylglycinamide formyltransferase [Candidatus Kapabacteria bacterium]